MVIFSVLYAATDGAHFDHDYYNATHIPLVHEAFGSTGLTGVQVFKGVSAGDGGPASTALFSGAEGIAIDDQGNLYICDKTNHRIRKIAADGIVTTIAGTGVAGFSGDGGPATAAQAVKPLPSLAQGTEIN